MKKLFPLFAALTLSVGLFAEEVDMKPFITYQDQTGTFDYPYYPSWSDNSGQLRIFRDNGLQDLNLEAGVSKIIFHKTASTIGQIWIGNPNWNFLETIADWEGGLSTLEFILTEDAIKCINGETSDGWSETAFILMGDGLEVTKIAIVAGIDSTPVVGKQFVDAISGLKFKITAVGEVNNVKVISNNGVDPTYSGDIVIPSIVNYKDITFTVTQIESNAFSECTSPTSITIPNSVTTIGDWAFNFVNNIVYSGTAIGSPWGAKCVNGYVDGYLVYSDASKTKLCGCSTAATGEITIPNSVTTIGESAFQWCSGLTSVTIPNSVTTIGSNAFAGCSNLTSVTIPSSVTTIGEDAFGSYSGLTSINVDAANTHFCSVDGVLFNYAKDTLIHYPMGNTRTEYTIPNSVTTIGYKAFYDCSRLTSVTIPNSVTTIGDNAFYECSGLTSVTIPNSVTTIGEWAFFGCTGSTSVTIGNSVTTIGEEAFARCSGLTSITIPNSVTTIGYGAFDDCTGLTSVTIGNSVKTIEMQAFAWCSSLTSVTISNSVTTIGENAFSGCSSLTSVTIPNSVTTIGGNVFLGSGLRDVSVAWTSSDQLPTMGVGVFDYIANWGGPSVATLHVPEGTKSIYENADQWKEFGTITDRQYNPENCVITYTATEKLTIPYLELGCTTFGPAIISHTFSNGTGTITCGGEITKIGDHAFQSCTSLTSITIPESVTTIGESAFQWCSGLTSVTIPNSVTTIGSYAFVDVNNIVYNGTAIGSPWGARCVNGYVDGYLVYSDASKTTLCGCSSAATGEIIIPNSVTTIEYSTFSNCRSLTSVTIGNSVTTIGNSAFYGCSGLTTVTIPNSVTTIGDYAFEECVSLTSVTIPNSVTTIGDYAFAYCYSLTSVTIGNSVTTIGSRAFYGCTSLPVIDNLRYADTYLVEAVDKTLSTYTIKTGTKWIGDYAFEGCSSLTSITIPNSVTTIGVLAFYNCTGLTSLTIPNSVTTIGYYAFNSVNNIVYNGTATWESDNKYWGAKSVNGYIDGYLVYSDASKTTLCGCSSAAEGEITIPNSVTTIGDYAFLNCTGLTSINIPNSVTTIGISTFSGCVGLTSINVDAANMHYSSTDGVLFNYAKDTLILYPIGNTRAEYTIPNSVTTIRDYAFYNCWRLTSITIPNSVTTIGDYAFEECVSLTSVNIPNSVTTIGSRAFYGCSSLASANIPNSVTTIKSGTFQECSSLISITIPNSVTEIEGWGVFSNCTSLESVTIGNSLKTIGEGMFSSCYSLTSVNIPNSVTTIGRMAFASCTTLVSIEIPASVTTIDQNAFAWNPALTSITIPKSVTTIGDGAFSGCSGLTSVTVQWTDAIELPTMGDGVFSSIADWYGPSRATLHIPAGTKSIYETTYPWNEFGTIIESIEPQVGDKFEVDGLWYEILTMGETNTVKVISHLDYKNLQTVSIPNSITFGGTKFDVVEVGGSSFAFCKNLTSVTIGNSVTTIGWNAFYECSGLTSVTIGNSVTEIGEMAFSDCKSLTSIVIPNSVITIGDYAFQSCSKLTSVTIGNSVTTIGERAFLMCFGLTSFNVDAANTHYCSIDGVLFNYAKDTLIQYPASNTRTEYSIPNSVTTLGYSAFRECSSLTSVTIPNSVTTIGECAFYWCEVLTSITCYAVIPPKCVGAVFSGISQDAKVYVPASSLTDYQSAEVWKDLQLYPIAADVTPMDDENPIILPTDQDVTITWAITDGADTYMLTISKNGETVCVLTFNAQGQLLNIAFAAPGHDGSHQAPAATLTAQGYQFTVTGLDPGTAYDYSVTATDAGGQTIAEHKGNFSTTGGTGLNTLPYEGKEGIGSKFFHNGNLIIERNGIKYTATGQKVR